MKLVRIGQEMEVGRSGPDWIDIDQHDPEARRLLDERWELSDSTRELLCEASYRNRRVQVPEGLVLRLAYSGGRVDQDGQAIGLGLLVTPERILTVRHGSIKEIEDVWRVLEDGSEEVLQGWSVLSLLVMRIAARIEAGLDREVDTIDNLEDKVFEEGGSLPIEELGQLRRQLIRDRRYINSLSRVLEETVDDPRVHIANSRGEELTLAAQAMLRQERTITFFLERANMLQDQIQSQLTDGMNKSTLRLGVVATVFLPLGFLTGLLGINVAGIPGNHDPWAFWMVCGLLVVLATTVWYIVWRAHGQ